MKDTQKQIDEDFVEIGGIKFEFVNKPNINEPLAVTFPNEGESRQMLAHNLINTINGTDEPFDRDRNYIDMELEDCFTR